MLHHHKNPLTNFFFADSIFKTAAAKFSKTVIFFIISSLCYPLFLSAQNKDSVQNKAIDTISKQEILFYQHQRDLIDITLLILHKDIYKRIDSTHSKSKNIKLSASPIVEYTLSTGITAGIAVSGAFFTSILQPTNISAILGAIKYTQKKQFLLPIQTSLWTPGNKFNFLGDWRCFNFPQDTYGLGTLTTAADKYIVAYKYVRFYEYILKKLSTNIYVGAGYQLDHHWNIQEQDVAPGRVTAFKNYGYSKQSTSSGIGINLVYDSRKNSISPDGGSAYANVTFLQNTRLLGSNSNWNSLLIDLRKYFKTGNRNVLAFWFYSVLTLSGNPPYLDLAGTGTDTYNNTGRGYEYGRFLGKKYVDLEAEFRFAITNNGLVGGVVFCNAASVSEIATGKFQSIYPGVGAGLRIKFNKFSKTSACLDFGFGRQNSRGFSGNLGEVF